MSGHGDQRDTGQPIRFEGPGCPFRGLPCARRSMVRMTELLGYQGLILMRQLERPAVSREGVFSWTSK
jgi:hypothetical protein